MKITIEILDTVSFIRAEQSYTVDMTKFPADIIARLVEHGITQKIGDAAAGKDGKEEARAAMDAVREALESGVWGRSRGGSGEPEINRFIREAVRVRLGATSKAIYKEMKGDAEGRAAFLWEKYESAPAEIRAKLESVAEAEMEAARKRKAKIAALAGEL